MLTNDQKKGLRGKILQLLQENHERRRPKYDDLTLWRVLIRMGFDLSRNDLQTLVEDLAARGYVGCEKEKELESGKVFLRRLAVTPAGVDLVEGTRMDAAVEME